MLDEPLKTCIKKTYEAMAVQRRYNAIKRVAKLFESYTKIPYNKPGQCFNCRKKVEVRYIAVWTINRLKYCESCFDRSFKKNLQRVKNKCVQIEQEEEYCEATM